MNFIFEVSSGTFCVHGIPTSSMDEEDINGYEHYCAQIKLTKFGNYKIGQDRSYSSKYGTTKYMYRAFGYVTETEDSEGSQSWSWQSTMPPAYQGWTGYHLSFSVSSLGPAPMESLEEIYEYLDDHPLEFYPSSYNPGCYEAFKGFIFSILGECNVYYTAYGTQRLVISISGSIPSGSGFATAMCNQALKPYADILDDRLSATYLELVNKLRLEGNNIANAMDTVDLLKGIKKPTKILETIGNKLKAGMKKGDAKDLWLKYRYAYTTSKADLEDLQSKIEQITFSGNERQVLRTSFSDPVNTHVKLVAEEDLSDLESASEVTSMVLKKLGLYPTPYLIWDLIPFSFVADWVLPIGDTLSKYDTLEWAQSMPYKTYMLVSHKGVGKFQNFEFNFYIRKSVDIGDLDFSTEDDGYKPTVKTWSKRGLDLWALRK